jgi:hypothetical protein
MLFSYFLILYVATVQSKYIINTGPICHDLKVHVNAEAHNFALPPYPESGTATAVGQYLSSFNASSIPQNLTVSGTFEIAATYCEPVKKVLGREKTIQLLLHGVGYTKVRCCVSYFGNIEILTMGDRSTGQVLGTQIRAFQVNTHGFIMQHRKGIPRLPSIISATENQITLIQYPLFSFLFRSRSYAC